MASGARSAVDEPALGEWRRLEKRQQHRADLLLTGLRRVRPVLHEVAVLPHEAVTLARCQAVRPEIRAPRDPCGTGVVVEVAGAGIGDGAAVRHLLDLRLNQPDRKST